MILGFNIGNTNTIIALYDRECIKPIQKCTFRTRKKTNLEELTHTVNSSLSRLEIENQTNFNFEDIIFSSVVPEINKLYHAFSKNTFNIKIFEIDYSVKMSITLNYDNPSQLGTDRIVNAEAAFQEYGKDAIIVDLGTATTFCILHSDGLFEGGLIAPGIGTASDALEQKASNLFRVDFIKPDNLIAQNTIDAITSGNFYGSLSMVEGIINRIELNYTKPFLKILTGGYADAVGKYLDTDTIIDSSLTLKGIKYIYNLNKL